MIDLKYCSGCYCNFYNGNNSLGVNCCWSRKDAKVVWRIRVGNWENPPYLNKKKFRTASCWHSGNGGDHFIDPKVIDSNGYWKG